MTYKEAYEQAKKDGALGDLVPIFKEMRKKGDMVIGKYLGSNLQKGKLADTPYYMYLFETDEGLVKFSLGAVSDGEVRPSMKVGQVYAVTFEKSEEIEKGRKINRFKIEHVIGAGDSSVGGDDDQAF